MNRIKLSECKNLLHIIAEAWLRYHKEYKCTIDGKKTIITY